MLCKFILAKYFLARAVICAQISALQYNSGSKQDPITSQSHVPNSTMCSRMLGGSPAVNSIARIRLAPGLAHRELDDSLHDDYFRLNAARLRHIDYVLCIDYFQPGAA
jgi:hypothetical protein